MATLVVASVGILGANAVMLSYLSDVEARGCSCATRPVQFRAVKAFAIIAIVYTTLATMARLGDGAGLLPAGFRSYTRVLDMTVAVASLVVHGAALRWVDRVSRGDCVCSDDPRRKFVWAWSAVAIPAVVAAALLTGTGAGAGQGG